jgi:hypothetical protein
MNLLEMNPIAIGAGFAFGAGVASRLTNWVVLQIDSGVRTYTIIRALGQAGCSQQQIDDHRPRIVTPHSFIGRCYPTCVACTTLGYPPMNFDPCCPPAARPPAT